LVGMAAVFAGAAHAPITAIIILFEMTDDYKIILPLMLAAVISYLFSSILGPDSIYDIKLRRRGGLTPDSLSGSALDHILVADAMDTKVETVPADMKITELMELMRRSGRRSFPVLDADGRLAGIVTERDATGALMAGRGEQQAVRDCMTSKIVTCVSSQNLRNILENFTEQGVRQMPVVDEEDSGILVGLLSRDRILWAYGVLAAEYRRISTRGQVPPKYM
jgi:CIC family chloride channel protein